MSPQAGFVLFFVLTLVGLGVVTWSGLRARRKVHVPAVGATFAMLATAIYFALQLGKIYDLESAGWITSVHLTLAKVTTAMLLLPTITGILTWKRPRLRQFHGRLALLVIAMCVVSAITGTIMILRASPIATASRP